MPPVRPMSGPKFGIAEFSNTRQYLSVAGPSTPPPVWSPTAVRLRSIKVCSTVAAGPVAWIPAPPPLNPERPKIWSVTLFETMQYRNTGSPWIPPPSPAELPSITQRSMRGLPATPPPAADALLARTMQSRIVGEAMVPFGATQPIPAPWA